MTSLPELMQELVGFFIIEAHVLRTVPDFRSQRDVDDLWDEMCRRIISIVGLGLKGCSKLEVFLESKKHILLFVQTLEVSCVGYSILTRPGLWLRHLRTQRAVNHAVRALLGTVTAHLRCRL